MRAHGSIGEDDTELGTEIDGGVMVADDKGTIGQSQRGYVKSFGFSGKLQRQ